MMLSSTANTFPLWKHPVRKAFKACKMHDKYNKYSNIVHNIVGKIWKIMLRWKIFLEVFLTKKMQKLSSFKKPKSAHHQLSDLPATRLLTRITTSGQLGNRAFDVGDRKYSP